MGHTEIILSCFITVHRQKKFYFNFKNYNCQTTKQLTYAFLLTYCQYDIRREPRLGLAAKNTIKKLKTYITQLFELHEESSNLPPVDSAKRMQNLKMIIQIKAMFLLNIVIKFSTCFIYNVILGKNYLFN